MSNYRQYALSDYAGTRAYFKTKAERLALIGKRVGFDRSTSVFSNYGTVTDERRGEIEIDNTWYNLSVIEQIVVLTDQSEAKA